MFPVVEAVRSGEADEPEEIPDDLAVGVVVLHYGRSFGPRASGDDYKSGMAFDRSSEKRGWHQIQAPTCFLIASQISLLTRLRITVSLPSTSRRAFFSVPE